MSSALAARMDSRDAERAAWMAVRASLRADAGSVARTCEADLASCAAWAGEAFVRDMSVGRVGGQG